MRSCPLNGPQQLLLPGSVRTSNSIKREVKYFHRDDDKMEQCQQSRDATSQKENFLLKCFGVHIEYVDGDHVSFGLLEPSASSRTGDAVSSSKVEVTGILDQTAKSMIVLFLGVGILWHASKIMPVSALEHSKVVSDY